MRPHLSVHRIGSGEAAVPCRWQGSRQNTPPDLPGARKGLSNAVGGVVARSVWEARPTGGRFSGQIAPFGG
jgi:hypothetical protein